MDQFDLRFDGFSCISERSAEDIDPINITDGCFGRLYYDVLVNINEIIKKITIIE